MTDEKICPIMSRPVFVGTLKTRNFLNIMVGVGDSNFHWELHKVPCQREKCMAWEPECEHVRHIDDNGACGARDDRNYNLERRCNMNDCYGHCHLIERGA